jgi:hypothetical protein
VGQVVARAAGAHRAHRRAPVRHGDSQSAAREPCRHRSESLGGLAHPKKKEAGDFGSPGQSGGSRIRHAKSVLKRIRFKTAQGLCARRPSPILRCQIYPMLPCNTITRRLQIADLCEEIVMS